MKNERSLSGRTNLLYEDDAYLSNFKGTVLSCVPFINLERSKEKDSNAAELYAIELNQTAFFPEGGGQSCDTGILGGEEVLDVFKENEKIWHVTKKQFSINEELQGEINFTERFHKMQNHSGEHIISGIIASLYGYENVGFHMSEDVMHIDVSGTLTQEDFEKIEFLANEAIYKNKRIYTVYPDTPDEMDYRSKLDLCENIRIVVIENIDACACCAPHVKNTGEIGSIKIIDSMSYKGGTRFFVKCGHWAYLEFQNIFNQNKEIMKLLSAKREGCAEAVAKLMDLQNKRKDEENTLKNQIVELYLEKMQAENIFFAEKLDDIQLRRIINESVKNASGIVAGFVGNDALGYKYIVGKNENASEIDLRALAKEMNTSLNGRGGGSDKMIQGSVTAEKKQIQQFFNNF
ncbi:MAG: alanyl-tRNA editing protein [Lachnospiraceae bacterium]|nr:alanyl-tRNA editing protein [Lachnospiraceae bacterium]